MSDKVEFIPHQRNGNVGKVCSNRSRYRASGAPLALLLHPISKFTGRRGGELDVCFPFNAIGGVSLCDHLGLGAGGQPFVLACRVCRAGLVFKRPLGKIIFPTFAE
jgi:hypothetical protein